MTTNKMLCLVLATGALAGCATLKAPSAPMVPTGTTNPAAVTPPATTQADCPDAFTKGEVNYCTGNHCSTPVNLVWNGNACQLMIGAQTIRMMNGKKPATLRWWLPPGSKWEFREESSLFALPINFTDQNAPGLRDQFSDRDVQANSKEVIIRNKNDNGKQYAYQLRVFKRNDTSNQYIESTDPVIHNDF